MEIFWQISLVFILVLLNGFFVAAEFALVAIRKTRIDELSKEGNTSAKLVQTALRNLDTYISATQLGITIASLALGWVGEPVLAQYIEGIFHGILSPSAAYLTAHSVGVIISFTLITILHIVLGEVAPKSIALQRTEKILLLIIRPLTIFAILFKPFIFLLNEAGLLVLKTIGFDSASSHHTVHSEEEIKMILAQSANEGAIEKKEADMVNKVFKLADLPVKKVMIPRSEIVAFNNTISVQRVLEKTEKNLHSRFPVFEGSLDTIVGFIHVKDIYSLFLSDNNDKRSKNTRVNESLKDTALIRTILQITEDRRIDDVLMDMRKKHVHIAIVKDEHDKTVGVVTIEDILESLVGEIHDEFENTLLH